MDTSIMGKLREFLHFYLKRNERHINALKLIHERRCALVASGLGDSVEGIIKVFNGIIDIMMPGQIKGTSSTVISIDDAVKAWEQAFGVGISDDIVTKSTSKLKSVRAKK